MMNLFEIRGKLLKNDQAAKSVKMNKEMALTVVSGYGSVGRGLLAILEVCSSNPVMGKIYIEQFFTVNCIEKTKKRPGMAQ